MLQIYLNSLLTTIFSKNLATIITNYYITVAARHTLLNNLLAVVNILKLSSAFRINTLVELTAYDIPNRIKRFTCSLFLLSVEYNYRLTVNVNVDQTDFITSLSTVYPNASWSERELREMFGIYFINNIDLRRLLTDYGFAGFPLRKDFPLTGYFEIRYDDELQQILYEPVQLSQEFRIFSLSSPWERKN